ncbi:stalk domain-containing protein [Tumebacillus flagellatus]|uniref:Copper amine oxidase-like N-terminal domain-containing protein n=1 Tax=Tumebacillus flagellatus TaxID=1157490 RepID=A0A074LS05_9BACL|nr:DUF3298 domain-containing protein [Tumebacillus flagellatus]KEO83265.1 hypothetical protein EL26_11280 [Tumebacillus flagellatus]
MKNKLWIAAGIAGSVLFAGAGVVPAYATGSVTVNSQPSASVVHVTAQEVKEATPEYELNLQIPVISGLLDRRYEKKLNDKIRAQAEQDKADFIRQAKEQAESMRKAGYEVRPVSLTITYEVKSSPDSPIFSMEVITSAQMGGTGKPRADFYNLYNEATTRELRLQDFFGASYKARLNQEISKQIDQRLQEGIPYFKDQFQGISDNQGFYVQNGTVVIVFDKYSIAAGYVGLPEFKIAWDGRLHVPLVLNGKELESAGVLVAADGSESLFVPLRSAAEAMGFTVTWNPGAGSVELSRQAVWTQLTLGRDSYFKNKMAPQQLGATPVLIDDKTYVPLAFFETILGGQVERGADGAVKITLP